ncbi:SDR family NAD(P)-dependent oxidoreductase [Paenibacillus sp. GSMTC-2017]|uniref:SDR family oxidoreductase n=1 Tax=Paenibacillus sp. GSMTC-2017 TaxID=2794350 RepID=UPI0018D707B6|nr:SDR family oxidoreductase [Paenibacillus sp. GSMTC-2017]MBH5319983.1 SDR family NAD(P)-dependent oxidoreductase [Paenibacillus sp. GSMTC-2017]
MKPLLGKIAVVAGATRGAGRGIAVSLGEAGATVYCTGRSVTGQASDLNRAETIQETAALVTTAGGIGIPVQIDHTVDHQVAALFERIKEEQQGQLDILVNNIWGGEKLVEWDKPFWEHSLTNGLLVQDRAVKAHLITSYYGAPLMVARKSGLIIEVTDGIDYRYRGNLFYSLAKISPIHLATAMAEDLRPHNVSAVAVTPGFLRSEEMLDHFGVSEDNWRDAVGESKSQDEHFGQSETPYFIGRGITALAADPNFALKSGKVLPSWELSDEYGFTDTDGNRPHWGRYAKERGFL